MFYHPGLMLLINGLPNRVNICQRATDGFRSANEHIMWTGSLGARIDWNTLKYTHNNNNNPQHIHTHIEKWPKSGSKWIIFCVAVVKQTFLFCPCSQWTLEKKGGNTNTFVSGHELCGEWNEPITFHRFRLSDIGNKCHVVSSRQSPYEWNWNM